MSAVATAVIGSAVVGGIASNKAAGKAADGSKKGIEATQQAARQARNDSINLFSRGMQSAQSGIGGALNFYQNNATAKVQPFVQGNIAAQQVLGQGATQANNAILGLPVDMSFANNPQSLSADYSGIKSAQLPILGASISANDPAGLNALLADPAASTAPAIPEGNGNIAVLLRRALNAGGVGNSAATAALGRLGVKK